MRRSRLVPLLTAALLALVGTAGLAEPAGAKPPPPPKPPLTGHLLALNDFHGQIDPPTGSGGLVTGTPAGGVEYLAHYLRQQRALDKASSSAVFTVAAGDIVGGSPLVSAAFHDEPAVEEMNSLGLDATSVGNHEFDEGVTELLRLQRGGCHPTDGCQDGDGFKGAKYPILASNVVYKKNKLPILLPFTVKFVGKVPVAFVGMTLKGTPGIVNPAGIQNVNFLDEATTANKYAKLLKALGIKSMVLLIHEGGQQASPPTADPSGCAGFTGAIAPIVSKLDPAYGIVVSGHTHQWYNCVLPNSGGNSLVTSAGSTGRLLTDITFQVDQTTRKFVSASTSAQNIIVANGIQNPDGTWAKDADGNFIRNPALVDPAAKVIADKYRVAVAPLANKVVGAITADIPNTAVPSGENPLGDVIADGMLAYAQSDGAQIAFMNPGGIRGSLTFANSPGGEAPGQVTYGEAFTVQPFNNLVVTLTYTGAQIKSVLEQQFVGFAGQTVTKILQVSNGFTYSYDSTAPLGSRISDLKLNGTPIDPAGTYRVVTNDFVANGGDGFTNMTGGTNRTTAPGFDVDALAAYMTAGPVSPGPGNRITKIG
jgi:5'-nucleotidase